MTLIIAENRNALIAYYACPQWRKSATPSVSLQQRPAMRLTMCQWLLAPAEFAADAGNIKGMYNGIKQALSPTQKKYVPKFIT